MAYKVVRMWHASHVGCEDLSAAEHFFKNIFGRDSVRLEGFLPSREEEPNYPRDFSIFTLIGDTMIETLDVKRFVVEGRQVYEDVLAPHMDSFGFAVEGIEDLYQVCLAHGIRSVDEANRLGSAKRIPVTGIGSVPNFFTLPESTGTRYQLVTASLTNSLGLDPRTTPGWEVPPVSNEDPLSIEFCSHHTVFTRDPSKGFHFLVKILHGKLIHRGRNAILETESTYVSLGNGIYELAVPIKEGTLAGARVKETEPFDAYGSITWKVKDLNKVIEHLTSKGIRILLQDQHTIITHPGDTIGALFGFTDKLIPGHYRLEA